MSDRDRIAEMVLVHQFIPVNHSSIGAEDHCRCGFRPRGWGAWSEHFANELIAAGFRGGGGCERFPVTVESRCRAIAVTRRGHLSAGHMVDAIIAALREADPDEYPVGSVEL